MEIEGSDGLKTQLKPNSTLVFGRGNGFHPNDLAVSRRHISFELHPSSPPGTQTETRVSFEVLGKNPVWVFSKKGEEDGEKIRVFKRFQRGELGSGDMFCLSPKDPVWFTLKKKVEREMDDKRESKRGKIEIEGRVNDELSQSLEISYGGSGNGDFGLDSVDVSSIDPVQEFGFLVIGHEFDQYPKQMICDVKNWDWFLEDPRGDSDEEDEVLEKGGRRGGRRGKRKKTEGNDDADEEWTGESEDEAVGTTKARKVQRPAYQTRSKNQGKPKKDRKDRNALAKTSDQEEEEEEYEEDDEDETLGGFIVEDETVEEEDGDEDEEEEEFFEDEELER